MTLRKSLGGDVDRLHGVIERVLDSTDGMIVLVDGDRTISYAAGFGLSPCQLELLALQLEQAVRAASSGALAEPR